MNEPRAERGTTLIATAYEANRDQKTTPKKVLKKKLDDPIKQSGERRKKSPDGVRVEARTR